jgi:hypothetical protein
VLNLMDADMFLATVFLVFVIGIAIASVVMGHFAKKR